MLLLQLARAASIGLAGIGVGTGFVFSFDGVEQARMEYVIAYGLGLLGLALTALFWVVINRRHAAKAGQPKPPVQTKMEVSANRGGATVGRDQYQAGRGVNVHHGPPPATRSISPGKSFERALGDVETELMTIRARLVDARQDGWYPADFYLPAQERREACNALEDRGLVAARRIVDDAYVVCDHLNRRVEARAGASGPIPEPGRVAVEIQEADQLDRVLKMVIRALGKVHELRDPDNESAGKKLVILRLVQKGETIWERAGPFHQSWIGEQMVERWTDAASRELEQKVSPHVAASFLQAGSGNGPPALRARLECLRHLAEEV